jgi:hypothetical protein
MARELTTSAATVVPPQSLQARLGDGLYEGSWRTLDINAVGFPLADTTLRSEKAAYPPPSPDLAPGKQFVLWLKPGTYTIIATVAWTAPLAGSPNPDNTPHSLLTSMTNAAGVLGDDGKVLSWTDVKFVEAASVATAATFVPTATESNFITQTVTAVFHVPEGVKGSFGALRLTGVSSTAFSVRPVPVLYALDVQSAIPFLAAVPHAAAPATPSGLRSASASASVSTSTTPTNFKAAGDAVTAALASRGGGGGGGGYYSRQLYVASAPPPDVLVTTASAAYVVPVTLFSILLALLIAGVIVVLVRMG